MRRITLGLAMSLIAAASAGSVSAADNNQQFAQAIATALRDSGQLVDYSIGVTSKDGVVTLKGRVANPQQMQQALGMTSGMPGVVKVNNKLDVRASGRGKGSAGGKASAEAAGKMADDAQQAAESAVSNLRKSVFPDRSVPAETPAAGRQDLASKLRATRAPAAATADKNAPFPVKQVNQTVSEDVAPVSQDPALTAPQPPVGPQMQMMPPQRIAMNNMANCPVPGGGMGMGPIPAGAGAGGGPLPMGAPGLVGGVNPARYDQPHMPNYAWPSYAAYPNYAAVSYPRQYSPTAWPYIGPFYPYPQVPLGWRKVTLEWDDGWWMLNFKD